MAPVPRNLDQVRFAQLLDTLADGASDGPVTAEVTANVADSLPWAYGVRITGCIHGNLFATLLDTHKQLAAVAVCKGL
jgi:hypothetical protein